MVTLKMTSEDANLLANVLVKFTNDYRPIKYGGNFKNNQPINDEEWLKLTQLLNKLPYELKL